MAERERVRVFQSSRLGTTFEFKCFEAWRFQARKNMQSMGSLIGRQSKNRRLCFYKVEDTLTWKPTQNAGTWYLVEWDRCQNIDGLSWEKASKV